MIRTLKVMAVGAVLAAAGCGGGDSGGGSDTPPPAFAASQLQGMWATCADDAAGPDYREVLVFTGSTFEFRGWTYPSTDGTCSGLPVLDGMDTGTFALGAEVQVANPVGTGTVKARQLDATGSQGVFYTIGWVSADGGTLRIGDDSGANNGDTPAQRPTALQPRARTKIAAPASFATLLQGSFESCRNWGTWDEREVFTFNGTGIEVRDYDHSTNDGSCGGDGWLNLTAGVQGTFSLGAALTADFGLTGMTVSGVSVDADVGVDTIYQLLWMDTYATVPTLYVGDDGGTRPIAPANRPTAVTTEPRYRMATTPPAFPAVVQGTWETCVTDVNDVWERFVFAGSTMTFSEETYSTSDGSCSGTVTGSSSGSAAFTTGAAVAATLGGRDVTAYKLDWSTLYTIVYVDTLASPYTLYVGDDTGGLGTSDGNRPTALQSWKPRFKR